jgi:hypothetical protein
MWSRMCRRNWGVRATALHAGHSFVSAVGCCLWLVLAGPSQILCAPLLLQDPARIAVVAVRAVGARDFRHGLALL